MRDWFPQRLTVVIASGYFNPLHGGHLDYLEAAAKLGDRLFVIVNNDKQITLKGSVPFMDEWERLRIVQSLRVVNYAAIAVDQDRTVCQTLENIRKPLSATEWKLIFANGGDVSHAAEHDHCLSLGIEPVYGVGGTEKKQSSSALIRAASERLNV